MDKRRFPRVSMDVNIKLFIDTNIIDAYIINISVCGALLKVSDVESHDFLFNIPENKEVHFFLKNDNSEVRFDGEIARVFKDEGKVYIAINFF